MTNVAPRPRRRHTPLPKGHDYYAILGVSSSATHDDLRATFRQLAKRYHPDVSSEPDAADRFREVYEAYEVLSDSLKRQQYDALRTAAGAAASTDDRERQYDEWASAARKRASTYARMNYDDFVRTVFQATKATAQFSMGAIVALCMFAVAALLIGYVGPFVILIAIFGGLALLAAYGLRRVGLLPASAERYLRDKGMMK